MCLYINDVLYGLKYLEVQEAIETSSMFTSFANI